MEYLRIRSIFGFKKSFELQPKILHFYKKKCNKSFLMFHLLSYLTCVLKSNILDILWIYGFHVWFVWEFNSNWRYFNINWAVHPVHRHTWMVYKHPPIRTHNTFMLRKVTHVCRIGQTTRANLGTTEVTVLLDLSGQVQPHLLVMSA